MVHYLQLKLAVKHIDCLVNQYSGKLTEVVGKRARQEHSNGVIQDDRSASGKATMASQARQNLP